MVNVIYISVLCTNPKKYHVTDAEGSIKAKNCIDIVIRHTSISLAGCQVMDKFRIQMFDFVTKQVSKNIKSGVVNLVYR